MSLVTIRLTRAEAMQVLSYLSEWETGPEAGWYYGKKNDFKKRHASIRECVQRAMDKAADTSTAVRPE
jgi:hypothetical protein